MLLLIDNYDSFTYNLYQMLGTLYPEILVVRNDEKTLEELEALHPKAIVISPGPGKPQDAGLSVEIIKHFSGKCPILGVCLGHQAIGEAFGGKTVHAKTLMHGKASTIVLNQDCALFSGLPTQISAARYHSLMTQPEALPSCLQITAQDTDGQIMGIAHKEHPTYGIQFHPESILTGSGMKILENFCSIIAHLCPQSPAPALKILNRLQPYLNQTIDGKNLTEKDAQDAMDCIMSGEATNAQIASFLTALRMKHETIEEITGFAKAMRKKATAFPELPGALDLVGTGGDLANSFNISTTSALVAAGAGAHVAKHGNRSVSSKSGAADVLEALGVQLNLSSKQAAECFHSCGITFLFAPVFHGSMRFAAVPRKEIGVRSVFNILGPLCNPANAEYLLLGVYDPALMEPLAHVLRNLGVKHALLIHGDDGLDELSISSTTSICEMHNNTIQSYILDPRDYGLPLAEKEEIVGGSALENARITQDILNGKQGAQRNIVLLNAGCALYVCGIAQTIAEGIHLAEKSIDSGAALAKLEELKFLTNRQEALAL